MNERVMSPEQLDSKIRVTRPLTWIALVVLLLAVLVSLLLLISKVLIVTEERPCVVTDEVVLKRESVFELYRKNFGDDLYFTIDSLSQWYADQIDGYGQEAYLIVQDMADSEIVEGMTVKIAGAEGKVVFLPAEPSPYETIKAFGLSDEDARDAGLYPGLSAWICPVLFLCGEENKPVLEAGLAQASVILQQIQLNSLVTK